MSVRLVRPKGEHASHGAGARLLRADKALRQSDGGRRCQLRDRRRASATAFSVRTARARRPRSRWHAGCSSPTTARFSSRASGCSPTSIDLKAVIGYVPQEIALYPELSAAENLRFFGRLYGLTGTSSRAGSVRCSRSSASAIGRDEKVGTFSGGMKRRANIAAGLLHEPRLLVLDEPTVGVDPQSRNTILETVLQLRDTGLAVLYTTHYMEEAETTLQPRRDNRRRPPRSRGNSSPIVEQVRGQDRVRLVAGGDIDSLARACKRIPGVDDVVRREDGLELAVPRRQAGTCRGRQRRGRLLECRAVKCGGRRARSRNRLSGADGQGTARLSGRLSGR